MKTVRHKDRSPVRTQASGKQHGDQDGFERYSIRQVCLNFIHMPEKEKPECYGPRRFGEYEVRAERYLCFWHFKLRFRGKESSTVREARVDVCKNVVSIDLVPQPLSDEQHSVIFNAFEFWSTAK